MCWGLKTRMRTSRRAEDALRPPAPAGLGMCSAGWDDAVGETREMEAPGGVMTTALDAAVVLDTFSRRVVG